MTDPTLHTDVALLKNDVARMGEFFSRLDTAIEKISTLSNTITQMLAVHDNRLNQQDETNREIYSAIEHNQTMLASDIRDLYRLLNETKTELTISVSTFEGKTKNITEATTIALQNRVTSLERWRFILVGGGAVVATLGSFFASDLFQLLRGNAP